MKITKQEIMNLISEELKNVIQEETTFRKIRGAEYAVGDVLSGGSKLGTGEYPSAKRTEPERFVAGPRVGQILPVQHGDVDIPVRAPVQVAEPPEEETPVSKRDDKKKGFPDLTGDGKVTKADVLKGRGVKLKEESELDESEGVFAPNHYCVHHGGVSHNGSVQMAEAVNHNYNKELGRVTHYDMKLKDGTILENVPVEEVQITDASLAEDHGGDSHPSMKKDGKEEKKESLEEEGDLNENLLRNNKQPSALSWSDVRDKFSKHLK